MFSSRIRGNECGQDCEKSQSIQGGNIGYGEKRSLSSGVLNSQITVENGGELELNNIEITFKQYGFIKVEGGKLRIKNCVFKVEHEYYNNEKIVYLEDNADAIIVGLLIECSNNAPGIGVRNSSIKIVNSVFRGCYAEEPGAAIYAKDSKVELMLCRFEQCRSTRSGGAILFFLDDEGSLKVEKCEFISCKSDIKGGGISTGYNPELFSVASGDIEIIDCKFVECSSQKERGGGIYLNYDTTSSSKKVIKGCLFSKCSSKKGGGIYDAYEKVIAVECSFEKCSPDTFKNARGDSLFSGIFKEFKEFIIDPTIADLCELKDGLDSDCRQFKKDVTDILKRELPPIGYVAEKLCKVDDAFINAVEAHLPDRAPTNTNDLSIGNHIYVNDWKIINFTHHGIYMGNGEVIHYSGGLVQVVPIEEFADGGSIFVRHSSCKHSPETVIFRAKSRLGESDYSFLFNNCEHFCEWCRNGE